MPNVAEFLVQLPEFEHRALANAISPGMLDARLADPCLTDPDRRHRAQVADLPYYLTLT